MGLYATSYRQKGLGGGGGALGNEYGEYKALESISNRSFQKGVMVNPARVLGGAPVRGADHDKPQRSPIPPGVVVPPPHPVHHEPDLPPPPLHHEPDIASQHSRSRPSSHMDVADAWNTTRPPSHHSADSILPVPIRGPPSHDAWNPYRSPSPPSKPNVPPHGVQFALHDDGPVHHDDFDQWGAPDPAMYPHPPPIPPQAPSADGSSSFSRGGSRKLVRRSHTTSKRPSIPPPPPQMRAPSRAMSQTDSESMSSSSLVPSLPSDSRHYLAPDEDGNFGFYNPEKDPHGLPPGTGVMLPGRPGSGPRFGES